LRQDGDGGEWRDGLVDRRDKGGRDKRKWGQGWGIGPWLLEG